MWIWLGGILLLLLLSVWFILWSKITFNLTIRKENHDDFIQLKVRLIYGLVMLKYEIPVIIFKNLKDGFEFQNDRSDNLPLHGHEKANKQNINKEVVDHWTEVARSLLFSTKGLKKWLSSTLRHLTVHRLDWDTHISLSEADHTATLTGALWALKSVIVGWITYQISLKQPPRLSVVPIFGRPPSFYTEVRCIAEMRFGYAMYAGLVLIVRVLKVKGGVRKMADHPIQGLMQTSMENIKEMVDVNTIVGEPVETPDGSVILPISRVGFGFVTGGSDYNTDESSKIAEGAKGIPFGGGSGGGVSINPTAFLVVGKDGVHVVPLDNQTHLVERIIESVPQVIDKIQSMMPAKGSNQSANQNQMQASAPAPQIIVNEASNNGTPQPFS